MHFDHVTDPLSAILSMVILRAMSEEWITILHMNVSVTADTSRSVE